MILKIILRVGALCVFLRVFLTFSRVPIETNFRICLFIGCVVWQAHFRASTLKISTRGARQKGRLLIISA